MKIVEFIYENKKSSEDELTRFEQLIDVELPEEYREYMLSDGGGDSPKADLCFKFGKPGVLDKNENQDEALLGVLSSTEGLFASFQYMNSPDRERNWLPQDMIVIGTIGGSCILLCIQGERSGRIYFWDDSLFPIEDDVEETYENICYVDADFNEFIDNLYVFVDE